MGYTKGYGHKNHMIVEFFPSEICGSVKAPPSKSMAHRLLICSGLAAGESVISGIAPSEDVLATIDCLRALGAEIKYSGLSAVADSNESGTVSDGNRTKSAGTAHVTGTDLLKRGKVMMPCRECGSTLRFLIPLAFFSDSEAVFTGSERLMQRPTSVYEDICAQHGLYFERNTDGIHVCGRLKSGEYSLPGDVSSQFISGLLFALPLVPGESIIKITGRTESRSYIDLTVSALRQFGVTVDFRGDNEIIIPGGQSYAPQMAEVEGDYSNAAFFEAFNLIGGDVTVTGLSSESLQGDRVYKEYFSAIKNGRPTLSIASCPDLGPVLLAAAAARHGAVLTDTKRLKIKESDRGAAMAQELSKLGAELRLFDSRIEADRGELHRPDMDLCGHGDHRIVMALSVLLTVTGGRIRGAEAVAKSMPDFFEKIERLGARIRYYEA